MVANEDKTKDRFHQVDLKFKDFERDIAANAARLSAAETVIKEVDTEIRKFSQNYVNVLALIEAAKKDIEAIQADQKETKALIRKIAWYVFGLLITVIGYGIVTAIQLATKG